MALDDKNPTWKLELALLSPDGRVYNKMITNVDPFDMPVLAPPNEYSGHTFDSAIQVMKEREKRTSFLREATFQLGRAMAERLEDLEGWNGEDRAERTKKAVNNNDES